MGTGPSFGGNHIVLGRSLKLMEDLDQDSLLGQLEAILMVVEEPVTVEQLSKATGTTGSTIRDGLVALQLEFDGLNGDRQRGFQLREVGGGWRIYSRSEYADVVTAFMLDGAQHKISQAGLETLAVISYLQPATRAQIAEIRGVNSDSVVRTLAARSLIVEDSIDKITGAVRYITTNYFHELLGIKTIEELPKISPLLPGIDEASQLAESQE